MRVGRSPLIFHVLLGAYSVLHLYAVNIQQVPFRDVLTPLAAAFATPLISFLVLKLILKSATKAGFLSCAIVLLLLYYGHVYETLVRVMKWTGVAQFGDLVYRWHNCLLPLWIILFAFAVWIIIRKGAAWSIAIPYLNIFAAALMIMSLGQIAAYKIRSLRVFSTSVHPDETDIQPMVSDTLPDIYYIILDEYGRADVLLEYYSYDNSEFVDALTARGFYVATESHCNYVMTFLSLASSLNMEYLSDLDDNPSARSGDRSIPLHMLRDNQVWRILDSMGYTYIHVSSGYGPTDYNSFADVNYRYGGGSEFLVIFLKTTVLNPFYLNLTANDARGQVLYSFERLAEISQVEGPAFVFAHLTVPHPPYMFDREGNPVSLPGGGTELWRDKGAYVEQLIYVNRRVLELVDGILAQSDVSPIIILQADHGTTSTRQDWLLQTVEWTEAPEALMRERTAIFNAYYLPGDGAAQLYSSITPVNTFRLIFDTYFGTSFGLLEDRSYFSTYGHPYDFFEVSTD